MLVLKALLVLQMLTAASSAPTAYEPCSEVPGALECADGLMCNEGLCVPAFFCSVDTDCGEAPEGYSVICDVYPTCNGEEGLCRLGPGAQGECPEGTVHETTISGDDTCIKI